MTEDQREIMKANDRRRLKLKINDFDLHKEIELTWGNRGDIVY